jgi:two-component system, cell cycle sensor histidine kinase and response regulator CckA
VVGVIALKPILLVDDEPRLLNLLESYLRGLGYAPVACESSVDAWERFERQPSGFSVVVVDLKMPDISGQELSARMLDLNPSVRLVVSSGYPFDVSSIPAPDPNQVEFLQKPYSPSMLARTLDRLLGNCRGCGTIA